MKTVKKWFKLARSIDFLTALREATACAQKVDKQPLRLSHKFKQIARKPTSIKGPKQVRQFMKAVDKVNLKSNRYYSSLLNKIYKKATT